jgi:pyruvate/2-oxoglutarate dehydrogenase complex dihydrolipoamide acyltransferase (E2) component
MQDIKVDEALWASSILSEGTVVKWFVADGTSVAAGHPIAELRIEDALHEITAPAGGRLTIVAAANSVIEPGSLMATLSTDDTS